MRCPFCRAENDEGADVCFKCGRGLFALTQGYVVASRYEILATLGQGGMGTVYKAHDRELDEFVALKVLRGDFTNQPEIAKRFRSEIKLARRIRHKNVCGIHEYGQEGHIRYIAMEFISGVDLRRVLRDQGALPCEDAFDVSIQVAEGLQAIHDEGIVHRDLKTPNLMRDSRGVVRLMDFGIAKQWESESSTNLTAAGQIVGTPEYMSPEQVRGGKIDSRSDIYALGIVIFELFTGQVPFRGETPMLTLFRHLNDPPPLEGPSSANLPKALISVLRKALAKEAADRYQSAREVVEALREAQAASVSRAEPGSPPRPLRSATAPDLLPEPAAALTPVPTNVPTAVPTLAQKPVSAGSEAGMKAPPPEAEAETPEQPTEVIVPREPGILPGPQDRTAPSLPKRTAGPPPRAPTAAPKTPVAGEPLIATVERPRPQTRPPRPLAVQRRTWRPVALAVGAVLAVGTTAVLIRQRTALENSTSTAEVGDAIPTTVPLAPQAIVKSPGPGAEGSLSPSPMESVSGPVTAPSSLPKVLPTPAVARTLEPPTPGQAATVRDRPATSVTRPTPRPSPSAPPVAPLRPESAPTRTEPGPTGPATVQAEVPSPTLASASPATAASSAPIGSAAASGAPTTPTLEAPGSLVLKVKPWAEVTIDGRVIGRALPPKITLSPGPHTLILSHPDFESFRRIVTIRSGATSSLTVDLKDEAVRRKH
jgi:serine/threonine protein kinase